MSDENEQSAVAINGEATMLTGEIVDQFVDLSLLQQLERSLSELKIEMRDGPNGIAREIFEAIVDENKDISHDATLERRWVRSMERETRTSYTSHLGLNGLNH